MFTLVQDGPPKNLEKPIRIMHTRKQKSVEINRRRSNKNKVEKR